MQLRFALVLLVASAAWSQRWELKSARTLGALSDGEVLEGITLHFARDGARQRALEQLLEEQHRPGSANYHRWLEPEEFANRFGLSDVEVSRVERSMRASGFQIRHRSRTRTYLTVSGTVQAVRRAFSTEMRRYEHEGRVHYANAGPVRLPADIEGLVEHVSGLDDFLPKPDQRVRPQPEGNLSGGRHVLAPDDFAVIYSIRPAYGVGIDGTGQKVAVVGQSNIDLEDMRLFRTRYQLAQNDPEVILYPGSADPGFNDTQEEANLDLQWAGAVARNAKLIYVYGTSVFGALNHVIDQKLAPIVSVSFSAGCEAQNSLATLSAFRNLAQTANAMGITWVNSSGDAGPAGCDSNSSKIAQNGFGPRFPSIIPEVTAVGGTELNDRGGNYWNSTNDANLASALSYIPEIPWNQSAAGFTVASGGGGISSFYTRPLWQEGKGVGSEIFRKSPDIALAASTYNGYSVIFKGVPYIYGGTSASAPAFAGMLALILQAKNLTGLGNVNRLLYPLAQSHPEAFQDIATGNNRVPCAVGTKDCTNGSFGYDATEGYDMTTGLGSIHFANLVNLWPGVQATRALVTLSSSRNPIFATSNSGVLTWNFSLTLKEHAGVEATVTQLTIDDQDLSSQIPNLFSGFTIGAGGSLTAPLQARGLTVGSTSTFVVSGKDANGNPWTQTLFIPIAGLPPAPVISGLANGASFAQTFAPGSIVSVFGRDLAAGTQAAAAVPLIPYSGGITASVNGVTAPFYYVSPGQVNLQIPYSTQPGTARLTLRYTQGGSTTVDLPIQPTAPGIFTNAELFTVPQTRCGRGETCILYITGQGAVSPAIATGEAPSFNTPLAALPRPIAPVSMTIGDVPVEVVFAGVPYGLVGVMQINFTVAPATPVGTQRVVVKVGDAESAGAKIEIF